eukprot:c19988_g3_i2.p1 GENE.c19988_g3_i2~~c19988_g3_i2.p1  ORF type:complete len:101 (+),score=13.67 c19988_g3_i2:76-378(+)
MTTLSTVKLLPIIWAMSDFLVSANTHERVQHKTAVCNALTLEGGRFVIYASMNQAKAHKRIHCCMCTFMVTGPEKYHDKIELFTNTQHFNLNSFDCSIHK